MDMRFICSYEEVEYEDRPASLMTQLYAGRMVPEGVVFEF